MVAIFDAAAGAQTRKSLFHRLAIALEWPPAAEGRPCFMRLAMALALVVSGAGAEGLRGSLTGGIGLGHDIAGGQFELGAGHWSGFAALGLAAVHSRSFAIGARWSARPYGSGFGLALQTLVARDNNSTITIISPTVHWRWRPWDLLVVDLGAGPAISLYSYRLDNERLTQTTCFGIGADVNSCRGVIPFNVELGLGVAF